MSRHPILVVLLAASIGLLVISPAPGQISAPNPVLAADDMGFTVTGDYAGGPFALCIDVSLVLEDPANGPTTLFVDHRELSLPFDFFLSPAPVPMPLDITGTWPFALASGSYTVELQAGIFFGFDCMDGELIGTVTQAVGPFEVGVAAYVDPQSVCYWRHHPEEWPVADLTIGGTAFGSASIMGLLHGRPRCDLTAALAQELVAARFNVEAGSDPVIQESIDLADAFLAEHPIHSSLTRTQKSLAAALAEDLRVYNEGAGTAHAGHHGRHGHGHRHGGH